MSRYVRVADRPMTGAELTEPHRPPPLDPYEFLLAVARKAGQWISPETRATATALLRVETQAAARRHRRLTGAQEPPRRQTHADPELTRAEAEHILASLSRENPDDVLRRREELLAATGHGFASMRRPT